MAAKKRKCVSEEPPAKRQKLVTNRNTFPTIEKKITSAGKSGCHLKPNKGLQQKNVLKVFVKPTESAKKAPGKAGNKAPDKKRLSDQSKQIKLAFKGKPIKNRPVEKGILKKTVKKPNKVLSARPPVRNPPLGHQNVVSKSSQNNLPKVTKAVAMAISAKKETIDIKRKSPSRLKSIPNVKKISPNNSNVKNDKPSLQKSVKLLNKTPLRILHLGNTSARHDARLNGFKTMNNSAPVTAKDVHETNTKQNKNRPPGIVSRSPGLDATRAVTKKRSDENSIQSRKSTRKHARPTAVTNNNKSHRDTKMQVNPKAAKKHFQEKKASRKDVPIPKPVIRPDELLDRRSQRLQPRSEVPVKSLPKRGLKKKAVSQVKVNSAAKKDPSRRVENGKPPVPKKKAPLKSKADASSLRPAAEPKDKKLKSMSKSPPKSKEGKCKVLRPRQTKLSKAKLKQGGGDGSHSVGLPLAEVFTEQSPNQDKPTTLEQIASPISQPKPKKEKGSIVKPRKEKQKEKNVKDKMTSRKTVTQKAKRPLKNNKASEPQAALSEAPCQLESDPKSKRVSILELCEEIAGEIESDTVEVRKEVPDAACALEAKKAAEEAQAEAESQALAEEEAKQTTPTKCFFPSKKTFLLKNKLNGKTSPINKSPKPKEMKPVKVNRVVRNNALNRTLLPNLEFMRMNVLVPSNEIQARTTGMGTDVSPPRVVGRVPVTEHIDASQNVSRFQVHLGGVLPKEGQLPLAQTGGHLGHHLSTQEQISLEESGTKDIPRNKILPKRTVENGLLEPPLDESFSLRLDSSPESSPKKVIQGPRPPKQAKYDIGDWDLDGPVQPVLMRNLLTDQASENPETRVTSSNQSSLPNASVSPSEENLQKQIKKLKEASKDGDSQLIIDAGQKRVGAVSCNVCGMLYTASNPEDETQHILFHNQFVSAVKYVGWKKERMLAEFPDGKIIMVFPDDPKYALRKVEEIREMVDNDLGFQQVPLMIHSRTKTLLFISNDKKVVGCLIAEHIQRGYRVIDEKMAGSNSERDKAIFESQKAWCCSTVPEPALCGISRIWVFRMMRRQKIASRMIESLRSNFIYGSYLGKEEIAFSDPTPDGKLFATQYCGTGQFLVYNFISGLRKTT
ncbi:N-acetyltransferase ESCO1 [Ambystoma mexicanum]|uniref:N-acetyltransferase ESCO1 n=1 Tax=Ambystoma mexicanum TaxID=8296 RepID=UPI0037E80FBE